MAKSVMQELSVEEIQRRARRGPLLMFARRGSALVISLLSTITIARLLSPREFGLAAMSFVIMSFIQLFRDFGFSNAILRKGSISEDELSFVFWLNAFITVILTVVVLIFARPISNFYHEPLVANVISVSMVSFIISGLAFQHNALVKRELRFDAAAAIEVGSLLFGYLVGLSLAYIRRDVWAIVWMNIVQSVSVALWSIVLTRWRPGPFRRISGIKDLFAFGVNSTAFSVLNFFSRNSGTLIIGHLLGPVSLGLFNRANVLFQIPLNNILQPLAQAALPVMVRLRPYPDLYAETYLGLVRRLCIALVPASVILTCGSKPLVIALLGSKWDGAGIALTALAPALAGYGLVWPTSDLLISQNRSKELRTSGVWDMAFRVGGALIGIPWGYQGVALGISVGTLLTVPVRVRQAGRTGPVSVGAQLHAFLPSLPLGLGAAAGSLSALFLLQTLQFQAFLAFMTIALAGLAGGLIFGIAVPSSKAAMVETIRTMFGKYEVGHLDKSIVSAGVK